MAGATQFLIPGASGLPRRAVSKTCLTPCGYPPEPASAPAEVITAGCLVHRDVSVAAGEGKWWPW